MAIYDQYGIGEGGSDNKHIGKTGGSLEAFEYSGGFKGTRVVDGQLYWLMEIGQSYGDGEKHQYMILHQDPDTNTFTALDSMTPGGIEDDYNGSRWQFFEGHIDRHKDQFTSPDWVEGQTAKDFRYSDIQRFIDPATGNIIDEDGLASYLQKIPPFEGKSKEEIKGAFSGMPNLAIGAGEYGSAITERASDIYGLQSGMAEERATEESTEAISGVYSPTDTGFGTGTSSYGQLGTLSGGAGGDTYGLYSGPEKEFVDWLEKQV